MFFEERMTEFSTVFQTAAYGGDGRAVRRVPEQVLEFYRNRATCAIAANGFSIQPCGLRCVASKHFTHRARSGSTRRSAPHQRQRLTSSVPYTAAQSRSPSTAASRTADSQTQHEQFELGAFDASLERGGQELRVNHSRPALRGSFTRLAVDARELRALIRSPGGTTGTSGPGRNQEWRYSGVLDRVQTRRFQLPRLDAGLFASTPDGNFDLGRSHT